MARVLGCLIPAPRGCGEGPGLGEEVPLQPSEPIILLLENP